MLENPEKPIKLKNSMGPYKTVFNEEVESVLVQHILNLEQRLFGLSRTEVKQLTFQLTEKMKLPHDFNRHKKMAGDHWFKIFSKNKFINFFKNVGNSVSRTS